MADIAEKRETGRSLMFVGLSLWVADLLVVFYLPAGIRAGMHATFIVIIAILAVAGLALMMSGCSMRGDSEPS
ncbi:MAG TPA: hypothetical protein VFI95_21375 [Terriglobales bacterium]|nr:hypothetical protein [Terriglobales bacterium]